MPDAPAALSGPKNVGGIPGLDVAATPTTVKLALQKWYDQGDETMGEGWPAGLSPLLKGIVPPEQFDAINSAPNTKGKLALVLAEVREAAAILVVRWITDPDTAADAVEAWKAKNPINLTAFKTITKLFSDDCPVSELKPIGGTKAALTKQLAGTCVCVYECVCVCTNAGMCVCVCVCTYN